MITVKVESFHKQVQTYFQEFFTRLAVECSRQILFRLVDNTMIGDASQSQEFYLKRQRQKGYLPIEGLSKGSWITELNSTTPEGAALYANSNNFIAVSTTFDTEIRNYKLGDLINLHNSLDYIKESPVNGDEVIAKVFSQREEVLKGSFRRIKTLMNNKEKNKRVQS